MGDFQRFHRLLDAEKGFIPNLYLNYIGLTEEVGELGSEIKQLWIAQYRQLTEGALPGPGQPVNPELVESAKEKLREELADVLAYLLKIANDAGIDLEDAYVTKMDQNWRRSWV